MSKASMKAMNELHGALATYFKELLESDEELSSGTVSAIITFLKNNNITVDAIESDPMKDLSFTLRNLIENSEGVS